MEQARAGGMRIGRPATFGEHRGALDEGVAGAEMARRTGLAYDTVKAHLRRIEEEAREGV